MTPEKVDRSYLMQKIFVRVVGEFFFVFSIRILQIPVMQVGTVSNNRVECCIKIERIP